MTLATIGTITGSSPSSLQAGGNIINANFAEIKAVHGGFTAGLYYAAVPCVAAATPAAPGATNIYMLKVPVLQTMTLSSIASVVTTAEATKLFGWAVYAHDVATDRPTGATPLASTGFGLSANATGVVDGPLTLNKQLDPTVTNGFVWLAFMTNSTTGIWQSMSPTSTIASSRMGLSLSNIQNGAAVITQGLQFAATFNTWPDLTTPPTWGYIQSARMPIPYLKYASIP